ncbi:MAG: hypothetical protein JWR89_368 [Tardiphaga sp.]|nr:hypothetical protein [Tardiphaga sp.]
MLASVKAATSICLRVPNNIDHRLNSSAGAYDDFREGGGRRCTEFSRGDAAVDHALELIDGRMNSS